MKPLHLALTAGVISALTFAAFAQNAPAPAPAAPSEAPAAAPAEAPAMKAEQPRRGGKGGKGGWLARLDTNKDGVISADEYSAIPDLRAADTNNDGVLSVEEVAAMIQKREYERRAERMMRGMDIDGDGKVTLAEIEQHRAKRFALMDRNNDGKLEGRELRRAGPQKAGRQEGREGRRFERGDREDRRWQRGEHRRDGEHRRHRDRDDRRQDADRMPDRT